MSFETIMGLLIAGLPVEGFVLALLWKWLARYIPADRLALIKEFVLDAVQMVEQQYGSGKLAPQQKKQMAANSVKNLLNEAHRPIPSDSVISDLIESAVYSLNKEQGKTASSNATQPLVEPLNLPKKAGG